MCPLVFNSHTHSRTHNSRTHTSLKWRDLCASGQSIQTRAHSSRARDAHALVAQLSRFVFTLCALNCLCSHGAHISRSHTSRTMNSPKLTHKLISKNQSLAGQQQQQQQQLYGLNAADPQLHIYDDLEVVAGSDCSPPTPNNNQGKFSTRTNETLLQERLKAQQQQQMYTRDVYENPASKQTLVIGNGPSTTIVQPLAATRTVTQQQQQQRLFSSSRRGDDRSHSEEFYDD